MQYHPRRFIARESKLALHQERRRATPVRGHQIRGPEPDSRASSCCEEWCQPSERLDADMLGIAFADVQPTDKPVSVHTRDMRTRRASGRPPGIFDMPLH